MGAVTMSKERGRETPTPRKKGIIFVLLRKSNRVVKFIA